MVVSKGAYLLFAFSPSSTSRRIASERDTSCSFAQASIAPASISIQLDGIHAVEGLWF